MPDPFPATEPVATAAPFTDLHAMAQRIGGWAWVEQRVFELFGAWAGTTGAPAADVHFGAMSRRHGWHAEVLFDRLPELSSVDAQALVRPAGPATEAFVAALGSVGEPLDLHRLVAAYRVLLPMLVTEYRRATASLSPVAEPSLGRWLGIILRDDLDEWCVGQELLSDVLRDAEALRVAADQQLALELLAVATEHLSC